ncbi:MAG: ROK family protein [Chloroflexota bacterium]|nr:ROK family protein [Chloroflexota bacterium]
MNILALDFGGTRTRAAWFVDDRLIQRGEQPTRVTDGQDAVIARLIATGRAAIPTGMQPDAIGIAAPAPQDAPNGVILRSENLPGWSNVPLGALLSAAFGGVPVYMGNDGDLGALAEYHRGARAGANPLIYMTISTGIGGGAMIDGTLFTGARGLAIEPGHQRFMLPDGRVQRLEELASGTALGETARAGLVTSDVKSSLRGVAIVDGKAVGVAALAGDAFALDIVRTAARWLGLGIANLLHLFNPAALVLGGSVTALGDIWFAPLLTTIRANLTHPAFCPDDLISISTLGDEVVLIGAAVHARQGTLGGTSSSSSVQDARC